MLHVCIADAGLPTDIEVSVKDIYHDSNLAGKVGVIRSVLGTRATVYLYDDAQDVDIPTSFLTPVPPSKNERVQ